MSDLILESFDYYGEGSAARSRMLEGLYAQVDESNSSARVLIPSFGAATGTHALRFESNGIGQVAFVRRVLPTTTDELFVSMRVWLASLPTADDMVVPIQFRNGSNIELATLVVTSTGALALKSGDEDGPVIATTAGPAVVAGTWEHLEIRFVRDGALGIIEIRVNEVEVLNASNLNTGASPVAQYVHRNGSSSSEYWLDDIIIRDTAGTTNNTFMGDLRIATLFVNSDAVLNWAVRARKNLGLGILDLRANNDSAVMWTDPPADGVGTSDYTLEAFVRFGSLPSGTNKAQILGRWRESTDERMVQLFKAGPDLESGNLVFRVSTDGTANTVQNIHSWPWQPDLNVWYHVAVSRNAGVNRLFINGIQQGTDKVDSLDYFNPSANARPAFGAEQSSLSATIDDSGVDGFMDEVRVTIGTGRYTADFPVPTAPFPRDNTDPAWTDVFLLLGFDNASIADESSFAQTTTAIAGALAFDPDDGEFGFQSINQPDPRDDTFIEAALIAATGVLTLTANPAGSETVTLGATTYTFVTTLAAANDVLIGATVDDSLDNLVAAINAGAGEGTLYGTGTVQNAEASAEKLPDPQIRATARTPGTAGNSVSTTEALANGSWGATTLEGGMDIPAASDFGIQPLPPETTGVRSIAIINRGFKTDSGSSEVTVGLVGSGGAVANGAGRPMTLSPTYRMDIFEADPDTAGALTPATLDGAKIRINRTV